MSTTIMGRRYIAILGAVAAGRCELSGGRAPDVFVDGLCCCDHSAAGLLIGLGLICPAPPALGCHRVRARITELGLATLADDLGSAAA